MAKITRQSTLEATLGRPLVVKKVKRKTPGRKVAKTSSPVKMSSSPAAYSAPPSSFMPGSSKKRPVVLSDSSSADDEGDSDIPLARLDVEQLQVKTASSPAQEAGNLERAAVSQDETGDEDEDELPVITPSRRRKRSRVFDENDGEDGGGDGDGEDAPIASSPTKKRKLVTRTSAAAPGPSRARNSSGEELEGDEYEVPVVSSSQNRSTRRAPRSDKEKARELLRRKRAGETIEEEDLTASSSDKEQSKGLYDTDSEHEALVDFDDDEEGVPGLGEPSRSNNAKSEKKGKEKARASRDHGSSGKEEDLDDFVVEDDDAALGVPGELLDIPLEFTAHRHKPLKEHFKHAVEWLVQSQINPSFPEKTHDLYKFAWRRLDDEVTGLASSKFASAAWKKDFYMALRARPYMDSQELEKRTLVARETCGACGRSNHPASWLVKFSGTSYVKQWVRTGEDFLDPVDKEGSTDSDEEAAAEDIDEDGNVIAKETTEWYVGAVCNANADMAHRLMHWKRALLDWVEATLQTEGYLQPAKMAETRKMKAKKRDKMVDDIMSKWTENGVMHTLFNEFKDVVGTARKASTTGSRKQSRWK